MAEIAGRAADGSARIVLGMGTGWLASEHHQHGFPFEDLTTRFRRLEEHLRAVRALWDPAQDPVDLDGEFVRLQGARFLPVPDPTRRLMVGGKGLRRTPGLAARYADELNGVFLTPDECAAQRAALDAACVEVGRDPATVAYSLMTGLPGRRRPGRLHRARPPPAGAVRRRPLRRRLPCGPRRRLGARHPDQAGARLAALADAGVEHVLLQHQLPDDLDMLDIAATLADG